MISRRRHRAARIVPRIAVAAAAMAIVPAALAATPVQDENSLPGNPNWRYPEAPAGTVAQQYAGTVTSIDGYTSAESVAPGDDLQLHVSTAPGVRYRAEVYRLGWYGGDGARRIACSPSCVTTEAGVTQSPPTAPDARGTVRADWPVTDTLKVGANWRSGLYVVQLVVVSATEAPAARSVPFVVRAPAPDASRILVEVPTATWQAYNGWGGRSLDDAGSADGVRASAVSFDRPYASPVHDLFDHELQTVRFLEREGYDVTYATDRDVDAHTAPLTGHRAVLVNGHGEYWTGAQRTAFETARDAGVNLAFMGGEVGYWQVRYEDAGRTLVGYKSAADPIADAAQKTVRFRDLGRPECTLRGVEADGGGSGPEPGYAFRPDPAGLANPWFAGTGLGDLSTLPDTVGDEWDRIIPGCATPPLTRLLTWDGAPGVTGADAVTYTAPSGARVFSAGSTRLNTALDAFRADGSEGVENAAVQGLVRNRLSDMSGAAPGPAPARDLPPSASFTYGTHQPVAGMLITLTDTSNDPDGTIVRVAWDLDGDGNYDDAEGPVATVTFPEPGPGVVGVEVTDDRGATSTWRRALRVAATPMPDGPFTDPAPVDAGTAPPAGQGAAPQVTTVPAPRLRTVRQRRDGRILRVTALTDRPASVRLTVTACAAGRCRTVATRRARSGATVRVVLPPRATGVRVRATVLGAVG